MAAQPEAPVFDLGVARDVAAHWRETAAERERRFRAAAAGRYTDAEDRARLAAHANRLLRRLRGHAPADPAELPRVLRQEMARGSVSPARVDDALVEAIIGESREFLGVGFLETGLRAARAVGRLAVRPAGRPGWLGTAFLVSPRVALTNHHVLRTAAEADQATLQMGFDRPDGPEAPPVREFALRPDALFITDPALDFTAVAVAERGTRGGALSDHGFLPLIAEQGKIVIGRPVNIIQHPRGRAKEIVLRANRLLNLPSRPSWAAQYEADTEPGSSGSPVLNDLWEVVALHRSGVPRMDEEGRWLDIDGGLWEPLEDPARLAWAGNEGIRASWLVGALSTAKVSPAQVALRDEVLRAEQLPRVAVRAAAPVPPPPVLVPGGDGVVVVAGDHGAVVTVPLVIRLSIEGAGAAAAPPPQTSDENRERGRDPDYASRAGFDADFCGFHAPLPVPGPGIAGEVAPVAAGGIELRYHHHSVIMNRVRRLAFVSAVNLDAEAPIRLDRRGRDTWIMDPRLPPAWQAGNEFYAANPLDRGHLSRRRDAAWGETEEEAQRASDDTFHWTNAAPQHEVFNQSDRASRRGLLLWGNLEDHILAGADQNRLRVSVFNGPIFRGDDRAHRGLPIPRQYFKVLALREREGDAAVDRVFAFILSQEALVRSLPAERLTPEEAFTAGPFRPFQVSLALVERQTGLLFHPTMHEADALRGLPCDPGMPVGRVAEARPLATPADVLRPSRRAAPAGAPPAAALSPATEP